MGIGYFAVANLLGHIASLASCPLGGSPFTPLPAGSYTAEAASLSGPGGSFTISISPQ